MSARLRMYGNDVVMIIKKKRSNNMVLVEHKTEAREWVKDADLCPMPTFKRQRVRKEKNEQPETAQA